MVAEKRTPNSGHEEAWEDGQENGQKGWKKMEEEVDFFERNRNKTTEKNLEQVYSFYLQATLNLSARVKKSRVYPG